MLRQQPWSSQVVKLVTLHTREAASCCEGSAAAGRQLTECAVAALCTVLSEYGC